MAFYPFDGTQGFGKILRDGLDSYRFGRYKLAHSLASLDQMSNAQVAEAFGFASEAVAATAKAELQSGIGKLLANDPGTTTAQAYAAVMQMLAQFG